VTFAPVCGYRNSQNALEVGRYDKSYERPSKQTVTKPHSRFHFKTQVVVLAVGFDNRQITDDLKAMNANPALGSDDVPLIAHGKSDVVNNDQRMV